MFYTKNKLMKACFPRDYNKLFKASPPKKKFASISKLGICCLIFYKENLFFKNKIQLGVPLVSQQKRI